MLKIFCGVGNISNLRLKKTLLFLVYYFDFSSNNNYLDSV